MAELRQRQLHLPPNDFVLPALATVNNNTDKCIVAAPQAFTLVKAPLTSPR